MKSLQFYMMVGIINPLQVTAEVKAKIDAAKKDAVKKETPPDDNKQRTISSSTFESTDATPQLKTDSLLPMLPQDDDTQSHSAEQVYSMVEKWESKHGENEYCIFCGVNSKNHRLNESAICKYFDEDHTLPSLEISLQVHQRI